MPAASNRHRIAAVFHALDVKSAMPPNARLWLALACMRADVKGRTQFGAHGYAAASNDTPANGDAAVTWLSTNGFITDDVNDHGVECWRLTIHDWDKPEPVIGGYSADAGMKRDGLPPAYGRRVRDVIDPPAKGWDTYTPPTWEQVKHRILPAADDQGDNDD